MKINHWYGVKDDEVSCVSICGNHCYATTEGTNEFAKQVKCHCYISLKAKLKIPIFHFEQELEVGSPCYSLCEIAGFMSF